MVEKHFEFFRDFHFSYYCGIFNVSEIELKGNINDRLDWWHFFLLPPASNNHDDFSS